MLLSKLVKLKGDPYQPRAFADIKKLKGNWTLPMYWLRLGKFRLEYFVIEAEKRYT